MDIIGQRLKLLRNTMKLSQRQLADKIGINISSVNRYENNQAETPYKAMLVYANFFDVSLEYIYGRTDNPQGKLYDFKPQADDSELRCFIDMCFDQSSPICSKLKDALYQAMKSGMEGIYGKRHAPKSGCYIPGA